MTVQPLQRADLERKRWKTMGLEALPDRFAVLQQLLQRCTFRLIIRWSWVQVPVALRERPVQRPFFTIRISQPAVGPHKRFKLATNN